MNYRLGYEHDSDVISTSGLRGSVEALLATCLFVLSLPLLALSIAIVWFELGRPILFRQQRVGLGMKLFDVPKLRTMMDLRDAEDRLLPDRMRQRPLTTFLRRLRFDEIPQLLAIARGEMTLVGPRPLPHEVISELGELGRIRCQVAPGLTGWAQVNGCTRLTNDQKLALDLWYIAHRSLALDIRILFLTVRMLAFGERVNQEALRTAQSYLRHQRPVA